MIFKDVSENRWSRYPIEWLSNNGILAGYPDGTFKPKKPVTREELAAALYKALIWNTNRVQDTVEDAKTAVVCIRTARSIGSGVLISKTGTIVTNWHVVSEDDKPQPLKIHVITGENGFEYTKEYTGKLVAKAPWDDLAIIQLDTDKDDFDYLELMDKRSKEGDLVVCIGHPFGYKWSSSVGHVTQDVRLLGLKTVMQTDAAINGGNSGGALVDVKTHKLAGIPSCKVEMYGERPAEGLGFAILATTVRHLLKEHGLA